MTRTQVSEAKTQAANPREKAAQRLKDLKRSAMRLAVYVGELGAEPVALRGNAYREWERALQRQYQELRDSLGKEAGQAARVRGRSLIRREGLSSAVADLVPKPKAKPGKKARTSKSVASEMVPQEASVTVPVNALATPVEGSVGFHRSVCQRKYRHLNFLSAMLHARRLGSPGLEVFPCAHCGGLHVGHDPESEHTKRACVVRKRLRSINRQLAAMEKQVAQLRDERQNLLAEQGIQMEDSLLSKVRRWLLRVEGRLERFEQGRSVELAPSGAPGAAAGNGSRSLRRRGSSGEQVG